MKHTFPCGHKGKGQYCHRCKAEAEARVQNQEPRAQKAEMERLLRVSANTLPLKVLRKAADIKLRFDETGGLDGVKGQWMLSDPTLFSVQVTYRYRMLFRKSKSSWAYLCTVSHEDYNNIVTT